ncbi:PadR family transcriptional regulator, partial [Kibdelosporangium lantanae]
MSLQHALLGVLDARPMSGYDLVQFFDSSTGWVWAAPQSQIYPTLRRMQRDELIVGDDEPRGPRLTRTVYSLTDAGRAELRSWLATPHELAPARDPFLLQAVNFEMIEPVQAGAVLDEFIKEQERIARETLPRVDIKLPKTVSSSLERA